jgi:hypothetical protein
MRNMPVGASHFPARKPLRPNGAEIESPGQRPGKIGSRTGSPERAEEKVSPFQGWRFTRTISRGVAPGSRIMPLQGSGGRGNIEKPEMRPIPPVRSGSTTNEVAREGAPAIERPVTMFGPHF